MSTGQKEEHVVLVDVHDRRLGIEEKISAHSNGGKLHRAVSVFVFNSESEIMLQQRADTKYHSPSPWSNTCCSHPLDGEMILDAAHRRLLEEMGFNCELSEVFTFIYRCDLGHIKSVASGIFTLAKQQGYFDGENPARNTSINPNAPEPEETYAYSLDEVQSILAVLPDPAATAFAVAAYMGLRHGEIQGLRWEDYRDAEIYVTRSIWNGHVTAPKTRKGRAPVPVIRQLANRLEAHRMLCKNAQEGPIFQNLVGKPLNMNNLLKRTMLPALNRCEKCGKPEANHITANHKFERDASIPVWHGWHSARRGLGSNLYALGVSEKVIQRILRHANVNTTATYYIKAAADDVQSAMETLEKNVPERPNFEWDTHGTLNVDRSRISSVPN